MWYKLAQNNHSEWDEKLNIGSCWKHIPSVCKEQRKHTNGYVFKYIDEVCK